MYTFTEIPQVSCCTPDIETLFITITNSKTPITIGVVYRPPSGDLNIFNQVFGEILDKLPNKNVYINGDFNINLHKLDNYAHAFEDTFIPRGYAPLISIATHEQPQCEKTCIDNIFSNSFDHITCTGTLSDKLSHHHPIFALSNLELHDPIYCENEDSVINMPYYDFTNHNVETFIEKTKETFSTSPEYNYNFSGFAAAYTDIIDECCLCTGKPKSKRTSTINPWITQSIINSIKTKNVLYRN